MKRNEVVRTISVSEPVDDPDEKNYLLQQAVSMCITRKNLELKGPEMYYELVETPHRSMKNSKRESYGETSKLSPQMLPPVNEWHALLPGVEFMHDYSTPGQVQFCFRSDALDGSDRIDKFIAEAFTQYQQYEAKRLLEERLRYHFEWLGAADSSNSQMRTSTRSRGGRRGRGRGRSAVRRRLGQPVSPPQFCKRYLASDATTFSSLFFHEKARLIRTINDFTHREGKFEAKKFAHRLGMLLHGPSGTGKTSIAKAISHYTKRHVVNISLRRVKSNKELLAALQDMRFAVAGLQSPVELTFKDVVFVLEDIDCIAFASETEQRRQGGHFRSGISGMFSADEEDRLTVPGFLNALDGMTESPGRMIVMTATHHERIHPSLVRPGRVHISLSLGFVSRACAQAMIEHYLQAKLDLQQVSRLDSIYATSEVELTPADMEAICLTGANVDAVLRELSTVLGSNSISPSSDTEA